MNGTLYSVATPIGNLEDITYRAVRILKEVDIIACEDTRETGKLLSQLEIPANGRLLSYHARSADSREDELLQHLRDGKNIALVSDRGTPGISDPGNRLFQRAASEGLAIVPIPGATAAITALQGAGLDTSSFEYCGFVPHKKGRQTLLTRVAQSNQTVVLYESPHRILKTLNALSELAPSKTIVLARELTKMHEEFIRGTAEQVATLVQERGGVKGEIVLIVSS